MRSIRRAAIAGATAATLIMGAATVATADEDTKATSSTKEAANDLKYVFAPGKKLDNGEDRESWTKNFSGRVGTVLDADQPANGARLFGSTDDVKKEPKWAQAMLAVTYIGAIGSLLGLVVFPAYNFLLANGMLPWSPR